MSRLEDILEFHLTSTKAPAFVREYPFHPERRWRFDFAWPDHMLAVECEGLTAPTQKSRHTTNEGFSEDCVKYNAAALLGWRVLRYTLPMIQSGVAITQIEQALQELSDEV